MAGIAYAQTAADVAGSFVQKFNDAILFPLIVLLSAIALVVFLFGAFEYVMGADNEQKRAQGQQHLLWGIIGFVVMVSAMAILQVARGTVPGTIDPANPVFQDPYGGVMDAPDCEPYCAGPPGPPLNDRDPGGPDN